MMIPSLSLSCFAMSLELLAAMHSLYCVVFEWVSCMYSLSRAPPPSLKEVGNQANPQFVLACYAIVS